MTPPARGWLWRRDLRTAGRRAADDGLIDATADCPIEAWRRGTIRDGPTKVLAVTTASSGSRAPVTDTATARRPLKQDAAAP